MFLPGIATEPPDASLGRVRWMEAARIAFPKQRSEDEVREACSSVMPFCSIQNLTVAPGAKSGSRCGRAYRVSFLARAQATSRPLVCGSLTQKTHRDCAWEPQEAQSVDVDSCHIEVCNRSGGNDNNGEAASVRALLEAFAMPLPC